MFCPGNAEQFEEETGIRHWWAFHAHDGWKHRDHWMIKSVAPLMKKYEIPNLPKNYGQNQLTEKPKQRIVRKSKPKGRIISRPPQS
jgi:hypothetical protein